MSNQHVKYCMFYLTKKQERFFSVGWINSPHRNKKNLPQTKTTNALLNDITAMKSRAQKVHH